MINILSFKFNMLLVSCKIKKQLNACIHWNGTFQYKNHCACSANQPQHVYIVLLQNIRLKGSLTKTEQEYQIQFEKYIVKTSKERSMHWFSISIHQEFHTEWVLPHGHQRMKLYQIIIQSHFIYTRHKHNDLRFVYFIRVSTSKYRDSLLQSHFQTNF